MCGIAGILRFDGRPVHREDVSRILNHMQHRGRDNVGIVIGGSPNKEKGVVLSQCANIGLAHNRLSIIDLSKAANQPMSYADNKLWISFNGEIYNYIELRQELKGYGYGFHSNSDTEVILAAYHRWGEECLEHFNGMFSFALWDERRGVLFCARDPIGIKPFYYICNNQYFSFASESQALAHIVERELNPDAIAAYLMCMYVPRPWSIFKDIRKLEPGCAMAITLKGVVSKRKYWDIQCFQDNEDTEADRAKLDQTLSDAVNRQLRSDVPVGAFLSGGIDSSMVVALTAGKASEFHTFSVGYEGHYINELPYARKIAQRYGTRHHELILKPGEVMLNLDKALGASSEPIADSAMVPTFMLCQMAAGEGVKVLLNGTGGDEVFGGYERYDAVRSGHKRFTEFLPLGLRSWLGYRLPIGNSLFVTRMRHIGFDLLISTGGSASLSRRMLKDSWQYAGFLERLKNDCFPPIVKGISSVYNKMLFDLRLYLPDELLFLLDQMTMAHTLEGRVPLVDIEVLHESFRFPDTSHVMPGEIKKLLRQIATPYIGNELAMRKKQGFGGPVPLWIEHNLDDILEVVASVGNIPHFDILDIDYYFNKRHRDTLNKSDLFELFQLYCFVRWHEQLKN
jgi:asparagine synthase (glutamine-hydrolysing)